MAAAAGNTTTTSLFIAASFASSGDFPQVSRDITERLESKSRKPMSLLSSVLLGAAEDDNCVDLNGGKCFLDELHFEPRLEEEDDEDGDDLFAPRLHPLSPSSSFDTSPGTSPAKSTTTRRSARHGNNDAAAEDSLATAFSNIQLVSPTYFQLSQLDNAKQKNNVVTPEELHAKGNYNYDAMSVGSGRSRPTSTKNQIRTSNFFGGNKSFSLASTATSTTATTATTATTTTPTKTRNSLSDMVHSVDLSLFPRPLQCLSESPVMARIGSILSGTGSSSSYASANQSVMAAGSDDSFHTAHMSEAAMEVSPPKHQPSEPSTSSSATGIRLFSGISPFRKRHHDGSLAVDTEDAANLQQQPLLSPDDIPASTRSKTASSFTASRHPHRIIYRLKDGKRGMSQQSKEALSNFLPRLFNLGKKPDPVPPTAMASASGRARKPSPQGKKKQAVPAKIKTKKERAPLPEKVYVLLLEMSNKLFEICPIDYVRDMTVGDVLAKVRTNASDPVLAAQKYMSLLNSTIEFSAPMLPLSLLLDRNDKKPLLTALPPGAGPDECRRITTILMGHPTLQRFWAPEDPFEPSPAKKQRRS